MTTEKQVETLSIRGREVASKGITLSDILITHDPIIDCAAWDAFIVFGMQYTVARLAQNYLSYRRDDQKERNSTNFLSSGAYRAMVDGIFRATIVARVLRVLRDNTGKPVLYFQQANPLEWVEGRAEPGLKNLALGKESGDDSALADVYDQARGILQAGGVQVLRQPVESPSGHIFTKSEYGLADPSDGSADSLYTRGD